MAGLHCVLLLLKVVFWVSPYWESCLMIGGWRDEFISHWSEYRGVKGCDVVWRWGCLSAGRIEGIRAVLRDDILLRPAVCVCEATSLF